MRLRYCHYQIVQLNRYFIFRMKWFLIFFSLILSFNITAQTTLSLFTGTVCDTLGNPVEFAKIYICNEGKVKNHEVTNEFGIFYILVDIEENDILVIQSEGFSLYARLLDVELIQSRANSFYLTPVLKILYFDDQFGH